MTGQSSSLVEWFKRFAVATFMTMGGIHVYSLWIRVFNGMLTAFRSYLDTHWTGADDPSTLYTQLIDVMNGANTLLLLVVIVFTLIILFVLWFLIGGIRMAEMALAVIIAPLVWPLYLIQSLDDIPKTAFRMFLGLNAVLLIVVAMLRLAVRMVAAGGLATTVWNFVPSLALLTLTVFLPSMIKRLVGQGHTGAGGLMTAAYALAGLKGLSWTLGSGTAGAAATAVRPPAASAVPQSSAGPSAYPVAPVGPAGIQGSAHGAGAARPPVHEVWVSAPAQVAAGQATVSGALSAPYVPKAGEPYVLNLGQSEPGSNRWDMVGAIEQYREGMGKVKRINHD